MNGDVGKNGAAIDTKHFELLGRWFLVAFGTCHVEDTAFAVKVSSCSFERGGLGGSVTVVVSAVVNSVGLLAVAVIVVA